MARKPDNPNLGKDHPLTLAGFIHEMDILEAIGLSWDRWVTAYRSKIPGKTFPAGRFYHREDLVNWWRVFVNEESEDSTD